MKMMKMACKVFVLYCIYEIYWMASERPFIPHVVADCFLDISLVPSSDFLFWSPRLPFNATFEYQILLEYLSNISKEVKFVKLWKSDSNKSNICFADVAATWLNLPPVLTITNQHPRLWGPSGPGVEIT